MNESLPPLVQYAEALGTPLAAFIAAGVAATFGHIQSKITARQAQAAEHEAQVARRNLRLALFDKRYAIYKVVITTIGQAITTGKLTAQDNLHYLNGIQGVRWLFNDAVGDHLEKTFWQAMLELQQANNHLEDIERGHDRSQAAAARNACFKKMAEQHQVIDQLFKPFLQIDA